MNNRPTAVMIAFYRLRSSMTLYSTRVRRRTMARKPTASSENVLRRHHPTRWKRRTPSSKISCSTFVQISSGHWSEPQRAIGEPQITMVITSLCLCFIIIFRFFSFYDLNLSAPFGIRLITLHVSTRYQ